MQRTYAVTHLSPRRKKREVGHSCGEGNEGKDDLAIAAQEGPSRALPVPRGAVACVLNLGGREEDQLRTNHVSKEEVSNGYRVLGVLGCACVSEMCGMSWIVDPA